ncbi:MAG TPA: HPr kinase/phosphorylase, partial [Phenylobacterium sp.]
GVLAEPALPFCEVVLVVACEPPERLPDPAQVDRGGVVLPRVSIAALESSAPAKLRRAIDDLG